MKTSVTTRGGYRAFFNGIEAGRIFLPDGDITASTEPTEEVTTARTLTIGMSFEKAKIAAQENLMCIEVHTKTIDSSNLFSITLSLVGNENDLVVDGSLGYSHYGYNDDYWHEYYINLYDKDTNSKWYVDDNAVCQGTGRAWFTWKWNDKRAQVVNYLKFYTGNMPDRRPRNLAVYGTNDQCGDGNDPNTGVTWTQLMQVQPGFTTAYYGLYKEWTFDNQNAYRCYKIEVWETYLQGVECGEFYLGTRSTVDVCSAQSGFGASYEGTLAKKECPQEGYVGGIYRECLGTQLGSDETDTCHPLSMNIAYGENNEVMIPLLRLNSITPTYTGTADTWSIYPTLPNSLEFSTTTGAIEGRLDALFEGSQSYTVTAANEYGSSQITLTLTSGIVNCEATDKYPATNHGVSVVTACPLYYTGYATVQCLGGAFEEPDLEHCEAREPTFFSYGVTAATYYTGIAIPTMTLLTDFPPSRVFVTPELPAGISMTNSGTISGTPTTATPQATYTISAVNGKGIVMSTQLTITVISNDCPAIDSFPEAINGATSTSTTACPSGMSGSVTRVCTNGVFGEADYSGCTYTAPTGFSYSPSSINVPSGSKVYASYSVTGIELAFTINPALPTGINFNQGIISGKATTVGTTTHTITASNEGGSVSTTVTITVTNAGCTGLTGANVAHNGHFEEECPEGYEGTAFRVCTNGVLGPIDNTGCHIKLPTDLSYPTAEYVLVSNNTFSSCYPVFNGTIENFTIEPELPTGLSIYPTGIITGMPSVVSPSTVYNVTGINASGSVSTTITLTVELPKCYGLKEFGIVTVGESVTYDCTRADGFKGTSTRTCLMNEAMNAGIWSAPSDFCIEKKVDIFMVLGIILIIVAIAYFIWGIMLMIKVDSKKTLHIAH